MKKSNKVFILICLVLTVTIFVFYNNSPLAKEPINNKITVTDGFTEANEILGKIDETKLAFQIEEALKNNSYSPSGGVAFQIYSSDKQYVTILMENIDTKDKNTQNNIQKIVNTVAAANDFNLFVVDIQKANK
ncbi:hypothetical protein [Paenisporosarcina quisquiliarum]|uniref:hypothetical protein n=1 Tax=Paenisporosarcina quisquiliarum TaxID=365346 RepID=UPI0037353A69